MQGSRYHRPPHQGTLLFLSSSTQPLILPRTSSELPAVPEPSSPVLEPSPPSEVSPDPASESVESRTLPRLPRTRPDERVVDEVDDCRVAPWLTYMRADLWLSLDLFFSYSGNIRDMK